MNPLQKNLADAMALHRTGDIQGAMKLYRAVLEEDPDQPDALHMMGVVVHQGGNTDFGLQLLERALSRNPGMAAAWYNQALLLRVAGRKEDAFASALRALEIEPKHGDACDVAGSLARELGKLEEAAGLHARAVALDPGNVRYRNNYAMLLMSQDDLRGAFDVLRDFAAQDPDSAAFALGNILRAAGHVGDALPYYKRVRHLMPDLFEAGINEATALLLAGDLQQGFDLWNRLPDEAGALQSIPRWDGGAVKHLLLHEEQGIGDALQCLRYIPLIRAKAGKIMLRLAPSLHALVRDNFPGIDVIGPDDAVPAVDARAQLMRLPAICGTALDTIPADIPYLHADEQKCAVWHGRFAHMPAPRFALVWAGNPGHRNNRNRSLTLDMLRPVLEAGRGHGVSLQKPATDTHPLFDAAPFLDNFAATAAAIMELDLIITVDTSVAHLAGALGKPVWVLIPFDPDWRWLLGREDSPWYPHMRLFRQDAPQNWDRAIEKVADDLRAFIGGDASVLKPAAWQGAPLRTNPQALDFL